MTDTWTKYPCPVFTGFGIMVTLLTTGAIVSNTTFLVTSVYLPTLSVVLIIMVLVPILKVTAFVKFPSACTVTAPWSFPFNLIVTFTGLDVESDVVPAIFKVATFLYDVGFIRFVIVNAGGTVSTVNKTVACVVLLPSLSFISIFILWNHLIKHIKGYT